MAFQRLLYSFKEQNKIPNHLFVAHPEPHIMCPRLPFYKCDSSCRLSPLLASQAIMRPLVQFNTLAAVWPPLKSRPQRSFN